ncbi:hypothetical protein MMYC01_205469 [Madurella mycetomatis]|uniref:Uncharacterized protein n=1 Tax=Madurella mycetomatis TaxID=100816 RepID=A0A175VZX6_9PEZI|nr:hypothetical protein MMYC01_205469 [Madurella mycetomatis]
MSRLFRPFQSILRSPRFASRINSGQIVRIERVRLKKAKPRTRFLGYMIKGALIYHFFLFSLVPADDIELETREGEEEPLFIPFPFTTRRLKQQPYSRGDPEDPELMKDIEYGVAQLVFKDASRQPAFIMKLGKAMKISRYKLAIHFPPSAPPTYEQSGLLVTDDTMEWTSMPIESSAAKRLERVLWPRPLALSSWAFVTALVKQKASEFTTFLGFGSAEPRDSQMRSNSGSAASLPTSHSPNVQKALERIGQQATRRPEEVNDPSSMSSSAAAHPTASSNSRGERVGTSVKSHVNTSNAKQPDKTDSIEQSLRRYFMEPTALQAFKDKFWKVWRPMEGDPPRGSLLILGYVEIETSRAWVRFDVHAWYNPKTKLYYPIRAYPVGTQWKLSSSSS